MMEYIRALAQFTPIGVALAILALTVTTEVAPRRKLERETVLIFGASSGIGEQLAYAYAKRGARLFLVARRLPELQKVTSACKTQHPSPSDEDVMLYAGDITSPEDLVAIRTRISESWGGLSTLHLISGLPSIQPILDIAHTSDKSSPPGVEGLLKLRDEARRCADVNFTGVTLAVAAFADFMAQTSPSPLIHHLSSVAALVPAPTRAIYGATKAAGLNVLMAAKMECSGKGIRFLAILPGTVDTGFREKLAASGPAIDPAKDSFKKLKLSPQAVVDKIIHHSSLSSSPSTYITLPGTSWSVKLPLSSSPKSMVWLPEFPYRLAHWVLDTPLGWIVERGARKKYGYR